MHLPTREEIDPFNTLDGQCACDNFLGLDLEAAESKFPSCEEDLIHMGPIAFRYYVQAAIRYLRNEVTPSGMALRFAATLEHRLEYEAAELAPIADQLADICGYLVEHHDRLGFPPMTNAEKHMFIIKFHELNVELGVDCSEFNVEDYIDLRKRCAALQQEFLRLKHVK